MVSMLRPSPLLKNSALDLATRRGNNWVSSKVHNKFYKNTAKQKFKERERMYKVRQGSRNPRDQGEEMLPFFT